MSTLRTAKDLWKYHYRLARIEAKKYISIENAIIIPKDHTRPVFNVGTTNVTIRDVTMYKTLEDLFNARNIESRKAL